MNTAPEKYAERMLEASNKKLKFLSEILELTKQQTDVINEETTDKLLEIIDEKQKFINMIDKLDAEFNLYFDRLKFELNVKSLDELDVANISIPYIKELKLCIGDIMGIIKEISKLEKLNNEKAKMLLNNLGNEIKKLNQGRKINQLYSSAKNQAPSYYFDKKK